MTKDNYPKAYKEVFEILKYVPSKDTEKIPRNFLDMIENNMDKEYNFSINENVEFGNQKILKETREILAIISKEYWVTEIQKEKINQKLQQDIEVEEKKKRELYNSDDIFKNVQHNGIDKKEDQNKVSVYKSEGIITKLYKKLKSFLGKYFMR